MELFIINTYLSLLIFNPLEAAVLFLAATGDFKLVFSRKFIKHWFILGTINFVFQYLCDSFSFSKIHLFLTYFINIFILGIVLYLYIKNFKLFNKITIKECLIAAIFNLVTIFIIILIFTQFKNNFISPLNISIVEEILINFLIKILQYLFLYIFWRKLYEKFY